MSKNQSIRDILRANVEESREKQSAYSTEMREKVAHALSEAFDEGYRRGSSDRQERREKLSAFRGKVASHAAFRTFAYADQHIKNGSCWGCGKVPAEPGTLCLTCEKDIQ